MTVRPSLTLASGRYLGNDTLFARSISTNNTLAANYAYAVPVYVPKSMTVAQLVAKFIGGTATAQGQLALYGLGVDGYPAALLGQTAAFAVTAAGEKLAAMGAPVAVVGGRYYWVSYNGNDSLATLNGNAGLWCPLPMTSLSTAISVSCVRVPRTFGSFPDPYGAPEDVNTLHPRIGIVVP